MQVQPNVNIYNIGDYLKLLYLYSVKTTKIYE
jgi:hypothetical protein